MVHAWIQGHITGSRHYDHTGQNTCMNLFVSSTLFWKGGLKLYQIYIAIYVTTHLDLHQVMHTTFCGVIAEDVCVLVQNQKVQYEQDLGPRRIISNKILAQGGSSPTRSWSKEDHLQQDLGPRRIISNKILVQGGSSPTRSWSKENHLQQDLGPRRIISNTEEAWLKTDHSLNKSFCFWLGYKFGFRLSLTTSRRLFCFRTTHPVFGDQTERIWRWLAIVCLLDNGHLAQRYDHPAQILDLKNNQHSLIK